MKKIINIFVISIFLIFAIISCSKNKSSLNDGIYTGTADGRNKEIVVELEIKGGKVQNGRVVSESETDFASPATSRVLSEFVKKQDLKKVSDVSGATITSRATKKAITNALNKAQNKVVESTLHTDTDVDVVVIGAGGAGMSAAIKARELGANVILLEKMGNVGGNTISATGGLNASETVYQNQLNIKDSNEAYINDTLKGGYNKNNPTLVRTLAEKSKGAVDWLINLGADLSDVGKMAGSSNSRTHRPKGGAAVGAHLVPVLEKACAEYGVDLRLKNEAVSILHNGNKVTGVLVKEGEKTYTISAKAVVLATGGFGANNDLVATYVPTLKGFSTTNHKGATGDGISLAAELGADFVDMTEIQTHPTVVKDSGVMITEAVRGNGAILVNKEGKRFVNEMLTRDVVSAAVLSQKDGSAYILFDQSIRESLKAIEDYVKQGLLTEGSSLSELANKLGVNAETLESTVATFNDAQQSGNDAQFGRKASEMPRSLSKAPYYVCEIVPAVHHTMGGVKINERAEVLNKNSEKIEGFFAAGEVTGGVHGGNRLGGNAVADIIVFGTIAGENAAMYAKN